MGPARTPKIQRRQGSSLTNDPSAPKPHVRRNRPESDAGVPGVQKTKRALRQTRRLLAKDNLAADVRVETERRQKALETDLHHAEASQKERTLAVRYHKIKFFERQKVTRKLNQAKKRLESADAPSKSQLESTLYELRVDLNYILHYPKTRKYISLFPPDTRQGKVETITSEESVKTDAARQEVRSWIRSCMEGGELWSEPELHVEARRVTDNKVASRAQTGGAVPSLSVTLASHDPYVPKNPEQDDFFDGDGSE